MLGHTALACCSSPRAAPAVISPRCSETPWTSAEGLWCHLLRGQSSSWSRLLKMTWVCRSPSFANLKLFFFYSFYGQMIRWLFTKSLVHFFSDFPENIASLSPLFCLHVAFEKSDVNLIVLLLEGA